MMKPIRPFKFKRFECRHAVSSMKIGVDAVMIGAWADPSGVRVLDVGCGCGVIALMIAQRNSDAEIHAVDIHADSIAEASFNFAASPWGERLHASQADFSVMEAGEERFDLIISNPPYFDSGVKRPDTPRLVARHQDTLSPEVLVNRAVGMLTSSGRLAMIVPASFEKTLEACASAAGLKVSRICRVAGTPSSAPKRVMMEFSMNAAAEKVEESLVIEHAPGLHTEDYIALTGDFYLDSAFQKVKKTK